MANQIYSLYINKIISLCKTLVIHTKLTPEAINKDLVDRGVHVSTNPEEWKYHMNLAGEYHSTDQKMYITSVDTLQEIEFNKDNLRLHRATAAIFKYGTRYYNDLLDKYPRQRRLILGIINPIPLEVSIAAEDGDVLYYDRSLVDSQEYTLISDMEIYIKKLLDRWHTKGYSIVDEYYDAARLAVVYGNLPMFILNHRISKIGTNEVDNFFIERKLADSDGLNIYSPLMTLKQRMYLYRNIDYIKNNLGTESTFNELLKILMNDRNLPLATYKMEHDLDKVPEEALPKVRMVRQNLNQHPGDGSEPNKTLDYLLEKENALAKGNLEEYYENKDQLEKRLEMATTNKLRTKVYESALLDISNSVVYDLEDILINVWAYISDTNRLTSNFTVVNDLTGDVYQLNTRELFTLYLYTFYKSTGIELLTTPSFGAIEILAPMRPDFQMLFDKYHGKLSEDTILYLIDDYPVMGEYISVIDFKEYVNKVYRFRNELVNKVSNTEDRVERAYREMLADELTIEHDVVLYDIQSMDSWLNSRLINLERMSKVDLAYMATDILKIVSDDILGSTNTSVKLVQEAMLGILGKLSSYDIQYISNINSSSYMIANILSLRLGDLKSNVESLRYVNLADFDPRIKVKPNSKVDLTLPVSEFDNHRVNSHVVVDLELGLDFNIDLTATGTVYGQLGRQPFDIEP